MLGNMEASGFTIYFDVIGFEDQLSAALPDGWFLGWLLGFDAPTWIAELQFSVMLTL